MQDEEYKAAYLALFNKVTDICATLENVRDDCIAMEVVPEYEPGSQMEDVEKKK